MQIYSTERSSDILIYTDSEMVVIRGMLIGLSLGLNDTNPATADGVKSALSSIDSGDIGALELHLIKMLLTYLLPMVQDTTISPDMLSIYVKTVAELKRIEPAAP